MARKGMSLKDIDISSSIDDNDKILLQSGDKTSSTSVCNLKDKILDSTIPSDDISRIVSDSINGINRAYDSGKETVDRYGIKSIASFFAFSSGTSHLIANIANAKIQKYL